MSNKYFIIENIYWIFKLSIKRNIDLEAAYNAWISDVYSGCDHFMNTRNLLPANYDWVSRQSIWKGMTKEEQSEALKTYKDFKSKYYKDICLAVNSDNTTAIDSLVVQYKTSH